MRNDATAKQQRVLDYFRDFHRKNSVPPTIREVMRRFQMKSPNGAWVHVKALLAKGHLRRLKNVPQGASRAIVATNAD